MDNFKEQINFQITEIDRLLNESYPLFEKVKVDEPDMVEILAISSILHSFYNGIEAIFELIEKSYGNEIPSGLKSHSELLKAMSENTKKRDEVISKELFESLKEYMTFRHFFRHAYSFQIKWEKLKPLADNVNKVWNNFKKEIRKTLN